jgi:hypothetical protein
MMISIITASWKSWTIGQVSEDQQQTMTFSTSNRTQLGLNMSFFYIDCRDTSNLFNIAPTFLFWSNPERRGPRGSEVIGTSIG